MLSSRGGLVRLFVSSRIQLKNGLFQRLFQRWIESSMKLDLLRMRHGSWICSE